MMNISLFFSYFFLLVSPIVDLVINSIFVEPILSLPLILYIVGWFKKYPWHYLATAALLIICEYFIEYDRFGLPLLYLIPITLIIIYLKKTIHITAVMPPALLTLCLMVHYWVIPWLIGAGIPGGGYTICKILVNIGMMLVLA
jgi:hypothetical protein